MKLRTSRYFIREALKSMKRNSLMTLASIATVAVSLFILGIFMCGVVNLNHMAANLENQVEMSVYLKDGLTTPQIMEVGKKLRALPDIKEIKFVNKVEAMKQFKERLGDQQGLVSALDGVNPLPNSYVITFNDPMDVKEAAKVVSTYPQVESSHYGQDVVEQIFKIAQVIRIGGMALIAFLACATLFIISNTIRLTVFARRKEIGIMKFVGATNSFIRWPFLIEGMILGFVGGLVAVACVWEFYHFITVQVEQSLAFLPLVPMFPFFYELAGIMLAVGIIVGAIGSTISIKQYMKV